MISRLGSGCLGVLALAAGIGTASAVSSCGTGRGGATIDVAEAQDVHVRMTEFALVPGRTRVRAGVIEVIAENHGRRAHVLAVQTSDGEVVRTRRVAPGASASIKVDFRPGRYVMYDPLDAYRSQGMVATVEVAPRTTTVIRTVTQAKPVTQPTVVTVPKVQERTIIRTVTRTVTVVRSRRP